MKKVYITTYCLNITISSVLVHRISLRIYLQGKILLHNLSEHIPNVGLLVWSKCVPTLQGWDIQKGRLLLFVLLWNSQEIVWTICKIFVSQVYIRISLPYWITQMLWWEPSESLPPVLLSMSSLPFSIPSHFPKLPETKNLVFREQSSHRVKKNTKPQTGWFILWQRLPDTNLLFVWLTYAVKCIDMVLDQPDLPHSTWNTVLSNKTCVKLTFFNSLVDICWKLVAKTYHIFVLADHLFIVIHVNIIVSYC